MKRMYWDDVQGILGQGGTIIGTARSTDFRKREGRMAAVKNLVEREVDALIVVGGDGSLTGADLLRSEWTSLLDELKTTNAITEAQANYSRHLSIVGLVGRYFGFSVEGVGVPRACAHHGVVLTTTCRRPTSPSVR